MKLHQTSHKVLNKAKTCKKCNKCVQKKSPVSYHASTRVQPRRTWRPESGEEPGEQRSLESALWFEQQQQQNIPEESPVLKPLELEGME